MDVITLQITLPDLVYFKVVENYTPAAIELCKEANLYSPSVTHGKLAGMIIDACTESELRELLMDDTKFAHTMLECVDVILAHERIHLE